jgi:hypothetical protein
MFPGILYKMTLISKHALCQTVPLHTHCSIIHRNQERQFYSRIQEISKTIKSLFHQQIWIEITKTKPFAIVTTRVLKSSSLHNHHT